MSETAKDAKSVLLEIFTKIKRNEIRVKHSRSREKLPVGKSKFGGNPSLPNNFEWCYYNGEDCLTHEKAVRPLTFLAQFDLAELAPYDEAELLPKSGILSFFYELHTQQWGFDPHDKGCARVFYFDENTKLTETAPPADLPEEYIIPEFALSFEKRVSVPSLSDLYLMPECEQLDKDVLESDEFYDDIYPEAAEEFGAYADDMSDEVSKLLGYPDVIQESMEYQCEAVTSGFRQGSPEDCAAMTDEQKARCTENSKDWTLLFQMGTVSDPDSGYELMWGDCGHICFWIKKQDLAAKNFDNVWLILQCG